MTASERLLQKALVGSDIGSEEWNSIQAAFRDRAFFSSRVSSIRLLDAMRANIVKSLKGNLSASDFRLAIRRELGAMHYDAGGDRGTIKDLMTAARLDLIYNTNREMAKGFMQHLQATSEGALAAFPAYELKRAERRKAPRDWPRIWEGKGGTLYGGRMIALKTDPIWTRISRFGLPHPPFDYNSGMDIFSVPRGECLRLGIIDENTPPQKPPKTDFNKDLSAKFEVGHWSGKTAEFFHDSFGDQVRYTQDKSGNVTVEWQRSILKDMFANPEKFDDDSKGWKLGKATSKMLAECDKVSPKFRPLFEGRGLTLNSSIAKHTIKDEHWLVDKRQRNMPVNYGDVDLVPSLWQSPNYIEAGGEKDTIVLCLETFDGGILKMPIGLAKKNTPYGTGLFKERRSA